MRALLLALMMLVLAVPASARKVYLQPNGDDLDAHPFTCDTTSGHHDGLDTTAARAWRRMSYANKRMRTADTLYVLGINPADSSRGDNVIAPVNSSTAGKRMMFYGAPFLPDSAKPSVGSVTLSGYYQTVCGFRVKGTTTIQLTDPAKFGTGKYDSISYCRLRNVRLKGVIYCFIDNCTIRNNDTQPAFLATGRYDNQRDWYGLTCITTRWCDMSDCDVDLGTINNKYGNNYGFALKYGAKSNGFYRNRFTAVYFGTDARPGAMAARALIEAASNQFKNNRWDVDSYAPYDSVGVVSADSVPYWSATFASDSAWLNTFVSDTIYAGLRTGHRMGIRLEDKQSPATIYGPNGNDWDSCYFVATGPVVFGSDGSTIHFDYNTIRTRSICGLELPGEARNGSVTFNTIMTDGGPALKIRPTPLARSIQAPDLWQNLLITTKAFNCTGLGDAVVTEHPYNSGGTYREAFLKNDSELLYGTANGSDPVPFAHYSGTGSTCHTVEEAEQICVAQPQGLCIATNCLYAYQLPELRDTTFATFDPYVATSSQVYKPGFWYHGAYVGSFSPCDTTAPDSATGLTVNDTNEYPGYETCMDLLGSGYGRSITFTPPLGCDSLEFAYMRGVALSDTVVPAITASNFDSFMVAGATVAREPSGLQQTVVPFYGCGDYLVYNERIAIRPKRVSICGTVYGRINSATRVIY